MKSGTIFDNVLITDDVEEAEQVAKETFEKTKEGEKKMKDEQDEKERKEREEEEKKRKEEEDAKKKDEDEEEEAEEEEEEVQCLVQQIGHFTPKLKTYTYILPTFSREIYKWVSENWWYNHLSSD